MTTDSTATSRRATDAELLHASARGSDAAFRSIYDRHARAIRTYALVRVGPDDCDDILVETFATAWRSCAQFDPQVESARPWLFGIATNHLRGYWDREQRWQRSLADGRIRFSDAASDGGGIDHIDAADVVLREFARLSAAERELLYLVSIADLRVADAAALLGISSVAARMRLMRARTHLRPFLDRWSGGSEVHDGEA